MTNGNGNKWWAVVLQGIGISLGLTFLGGIILVAVHLQRFDIHESPEIKENRIERHIRPIEEDIEEIKDSIHRIEDWMREDG